MSQNFSSGVNRMWRLLTSHSFHPWYVPWEKPAQSTWGRCWWKAIPWKNRLSPPEDAVDERLSYGKTGSVHLRTPLMKGYPMEKPEMSWPYFGRTGDVHNFANVTSPVLPLNPSFFSFLWVTVFISELYFKVLVIRKLTYHIKILVHGHPVHLAFGELV